MTNPSDTGWRGLWAWLFCLPLVPVLLACAALDPRLEAPSVYVTALSLGESTLLEQRYTLRLRLQNPNQQTLSIEGLSFELELNGQPFAEGVSAEPLELPGFGEKELVVSASSHLGRVVEQLMGLMDEGRQSLDYRLRGKLALQGWVGRLPFEREGSIRLSPAPAKPAPGGV